MANTLRITAAITAIIGSLTGKGGGSISQTIAGNALIATGQNVGTSAEALIVGDVNTIGYLYIENLSAINYLEIDSANTFDKFPQKILPREFVLLKPQTATLYVKANTAAVDIAIVATEL